MRGLRGGAWGDNQVTCQWRGPRGTLRPSGRRGRRGSHGGSSGGLGLPCHLLPNPATSASSCLRLVVIVRGAVTDA
eukprot:scaffold82317_cov65-Phaeocystis_antarctica.AAC.2